MKTNTQPTAQDVEVIRDYILLPYMMTMIERSRLEIVNSTNPMRDLMSRLLNAMLDIINADLRQIKITMSKSNIKVWDDEHAGAVLYYRYRCRGYEDRFGMVREVMRAEISVRLTKYGSQLLKEKQERGHSEVKSELLMH
jgi:hypothetical protein